MRSCVSAFVAILALALSSTAVHAQSAETVFSDLKAGEAELRRDLDLAPQLRAQPPGEATSALLHRVRLAVSAYQSMARKFPRSGYSDNALWQGAVLSADAFWQFGDSRDRAAALRLFEQLKAGYPSSSLVAQIGSHDTRLNGPETAPSPVTLKAIRRDALPDALRITLELEREATFHDERLDGPARVFIDLRNTRAVDALKDATVPFPDDVVKQVRIGRQADNRTRVVFDLQGAGRHSVYSLYNPYRIVVDFERTAPQAAPVAAKATAAAPTTPPAVENAVAKVAATPAPAPKPAAALPAPPPAKPIAPAAANARGGFSLSRQLGLGVGRIVIDPGHGGHDPGAQVKGLNEAELVLDISLRLEKLLLQEPGVEVVLTRRTNRYISLEERTAIANKAGADLFLSIHANASSNVNVRGFETYFLSFAPNPDAEALAARENAGSSRTMGNLPELVKAITLNNKLDESRDFAAMVQQSMSEQLRKADRTARNLGVKQAPFMVLVGATMPSALTEVSFLTNKNEASLLRDSPYRQRIAEALFAGIMKYQQSLKALPRVAQSN
jgi:N-acetylmuramoyl-L-alanine amidase